MTITLANLFRRRPPSPWTPVSTPPPDGADIVTLRANGTVWRCPVAASYHADVAKGWIVAWMPFVAPAEGEKR